MSSKNQDNSPRKRQRVAVIGAGPGGYPAAFLGADVGLDVTLVDPRPEPGGVCLHEGCIPSKTLLHVARIIHESREAQEWGVHFPNPRIDVDRLREHSREVVSKLTGGLATLGKQRGVRYVQGRARFNDARTLEIETAGDDGGKEKLEFDHAIIATGSRPASLEGFEFDRSAVWDSTEALKLEEVPKTLLVIGGGYIGLEMGTIYAALGSKVTIVEMTDGLLPGVDSDLVDPLLKRLDPESDGAFAEILLQTRVEGLEPYAHGVSVTLRDHADETSTRKFQRVLVATGRHPVVEDLGLEHTDVRVSKHGFIEVDHQQRTHEPAIYAIGDVAGGPMLAHKASHEGRVAIEAIAGRPSVKESVVPAVVFTDPEIAWVGLSESAARRDGLDVQIVRFPWSASGRARTVGRSEGLTKLVIEPRTERILGVGICGIGAGELIAEGTLAVEAGLRATDLMLTIHPHPTLSETVMEAAGDYLGHSTHKPPNAPGGDSS